jgi:hypothetical protein
MSGVTAIQGTKLARTKENVRIDDGSPLCEANGGVQASAMSVQAVQMVTALKARNLWSLAMLAL